jgi:hypothetical protein
VAERDLHVADAAEQAAEAERPVSLGARAGHMAHVDQPDRWLAAVEDFLG